MEIPTLTSTAPSVNVQARTDIMALIKRGNMKPMPQYLSEMEPSDNRLLIGDPKLFDSCFALEIVMIEEHIQFIRDLHSRINLDKMARNNDLYLVARANTDPDENSWVAGLGNKKYRDEYFTMNSIRHRFGTNPDGEHIAWMPMNHTGLLLEQEANNFDKYSWDVTGIEIDWWDVTFYLKSNVGTYLGNTR